MTELSNDLTQLDQWSPSKSFTGSSSHDSVSAKKEANWRRILAQEVTVPQRPGEQPVSRCPLRVFSTAKRETFWEKLAAIEGKSSQCLVWAMRGRGKPGAFMQWQRFATKTCFHLSGSILLLNSSQMTCKLNAASRGTRTKVPVDSSICSAGAAVTHRDGICFEGNILPS